MDRRQPKFPRAARGAIAEPRNDVRASVDHANAAGRPPGPRRDRWDRLIIAQAMAGGFTVVSEGAVFRDYGVPVRW